MQDVSPMSVRMRLQQLIHTTLDILFPPDPFEKEIEQLSFDEFKKRCGNPTENNHTHITSLFHYKNTFVKKVIETIKYKENTIIANTIGKLLADKIIADDYNNVLLVPVPQSKQRRREKGFNQCELLCTSILKHTPKAQQTSYSPTLLQRIKHRTSQTKLNRARRLRNIYGTMCLNRKEKADYRNKTIIVIDDVWTTGATTNEAIRALSEITPHIYVYTVAH